MRKRARNLELAEFARKLGELERKYKVTVRADDPFCDTILMDNETKELYSYDESGIEPY